MYLMTFLSCLVGYQYHISTLLIFAAKPVSGLITLVNSHSSIKVFSVNCKYLATNNFILFNDLVGYSKTKPSLFK